MRLRHTAIGVNYIDVYLRTDYHPLLQPPGVPGLEGAGVVVDVGPGGQRHPRRRSRDLRLHAAGAYAGISHDEGRSAGRAAATTFPTRAAAAGLLKGVTARSSCSHRVHQVKEGDSIPRARRRRRCRSAPCVSGRARPRRHVVIGTVGSLEKARIARAHGCAYPILYTEEGFRGRSHEITGRRGCDVVYDAVGRDTFLRSYEALALPRPPRQLHGRGLPAPSSR